MPSKLAESVKAAIGAFITQKTSEDSEIPIDILRTIRDEASLLMEKQTICDAFDCNALGFYDDDENSDLKNQVERLKVSC